jgi:hypothetical protein
MLMLVLAPGKSHLPEICQEWLVTRGMCKRDAGRYTHRCEVRVRHKFTDCKNSPNVF